MSKMALAHFDYFGSLGFRNLSRSLLISRVTTGRQAVRLHWITADPPVCYFLAQKATQR
jgi:hypothetical protein